MKKIDVLNFITDFRKSPNAVKTYSQLVSHLGPDNQQALNQWLAELKHSKVLKETEINGEKAYQVSF
jgi:hypothetical protein